MSSAQVATFHSFSLLLICHWLIFTFIANICFKFSSGCCFFCPFSFRFGLFALVFVYRAQGSLLLVWRRHWIIWCLFYFHVNKLNHKNESPYHIIRSDENIAVIFFFCRCCCYSLDFSKDLFSCYFIPRIWISTYYLMHRAPASVHSQTHTIPIVSRLLWEQKNGAKNERRIGRNERIKNRIKPNISILSQHRRKKSGKSSFAFSRLLPAAFFAMASHWTHVDFDIRLYVCILFK